METGGCGAKCTLLADCCRACWEAHGRARGWIGGPLAEAGDRTLLVATRRTGEPLPLPEDDEEPCA